MRNPFRKRRRLPGAESAWDESEHIDINDDYVAVPLDQLPGEAVKRLEGVKLYRDPETGDPAVMVDVLSVQAELDQWVERRSGEAARGEADLPTDEEMGAANFEAFNNTAHWVREGIDALPDEDGDDEIPRYALMKVNPLTGHIGD